MSDTKKSNKKYIYIGIGLVIFILIAVGAFFLWNKQKSSNESDSAEEEEDINPEDLSADIKEYRKRDWTNKETGMSNYSVPSLPANISVSRAKDELLEWLYQHSGKSWDKKKIQRTLEKNAKVINLADKKGNEEDPLFNPKLVESVAEKYQPDTLYNRLPDQEKFAEVIGETKLSMHFLFINFKFLKYRSNKKIDWLASLREITNKREKSKNEEDFKKMTNHLKGNVNPFMEQHCRKFPELTNLKELNKWANTLARKEAAAERLAFDRYFLARRIDKKVPSPAKEEGRQLIRWVGLKNEKFGLEPLIIVFGHKEDK